MAAKKTMTDFGLKSATFVSSPYHMRRIKLIVSSVFKEEKREFYFVPTAYEKAPANFWELSSAEWKKVGREYTKMIWFFLYSRWAKMTPVSYGPLNLPALSFFIASSAKLR